LSIKLIGGVALGALAFVGAPLPDYACGIDGVPSMSADETLVQRNPIIPRTPAQVSRWSPFIFLTPLTVGRPTTFSENKRALAQTLPLAVMIRPWRWLFGDGAMSYGWTVHHTYTRSGRWIVIADAFVQESQRWELFDQAIVVVRRRPFVVRSSTF